MATETQGDDVRAIKAIIARQFACLNWAPGRTADWDTFAADFHPEASLFPSARPPKRQTVDRFIERMKGLVGTKLRCFDEKVLGTEIRVFGNVAVAIAACEMTENAEEVNRNVEMMLLVKDEGAWRVVAQAWDGESATNPIPAYVQSQTGAMS